MRCPRWKRRYPRRKRSKQRRPADPLDEAVRALARRDYSARALDARLERAGIDEAERKAAIERLVRAGYLDDVRFAHSRAAALAARGVGDAAIRFDLEQQGVGAELAETAIAGLEPESERARAQAAALGGGQKAARALARKGFAEESLETLSADVAHEGEQAVG